MARIVVAGVVRNCVSTLRSELNKIEGAFKNHELVRIVLVESDSTDGSAEMLTKWSSEAEKNTSFSFPQLEAAYPRRTERLAYCRNVYMTFLERSEFFHADYLFISDFDRLNTHLTFSVLDQVLETLKLVPGAAATANQLYKYYDIWALRHPIWSPNDCWASFHELRHSLGDLNAHRICVESRTIHLDQRSPLIEVDSAFGGGAVYDTSKLPGCRYQGLESGREVCEHVSFSRAYRANGGRIFIHPGFINHDISEHVLNAEKFEHTLTSASMVNNG